MDKRLGGNRLHHTRPEEQAAQQPPRWQKRQSALASVLVVGGYPTLRHGITLFIRELPWLVACGETGNAAEARQACEKLRPDLIVLDMELANGDALCLMADFSRLHPKARTLAMSNREDVHWLHRIFKAGASGYMSKWDPESELSNGLLQLE